MPHQPSTPNRYASRINQQPSTQRKIKRWLLPYLGSVSACALTTLLLSPLYRALDLANSLMLFLLTVVGVALRFGRGPAVLAAFLAVAAFDFFFVPPRLSFSVADVRYLITFAVMLSVALVIGQLMATLKAQTRTANQREMRAQALYEMARELSTALVYEQIAEISTRLIKRMCSAESVIFVPDNNEQLKSIDFEKSADTLASPDSNSSSQAYTQLSTEIDLDIVQSVYQQEKETKAPTSSAATSATTPILYLPLKAAMRVRGVLALKPHLAVWLNHTEQQRLLSTFAALIALTLERIHYVEIAQKAQLEMASEQLRNSVLTVVSHDLRTPLTALIGFADTLFLTRSSLPTKQREAVQTIRDLAQRMNALVSNLLEMARLQNSNIKLNPQWQPLEEVIGSAIRHTEFALGTRALNVDLPAHLLLVEFDAVLIERVLVNLLENAAKYTPPDATVHLTATIKQEKKGKQLEISVRDNGPGLPVGKQDLLFEKFTRGQIESAIPGVGLGLAICKTILTAHGGTIRAQPVIPHGTNFILTLPQGTPPDLEESHSL